MVKLTNPDKAALRALRNAGNRKLSLREIKESTGMSDALARATMRELFRAGYTEKTGSKYRLTEGGRKVEL